MRNFRIEFGVYLLLKRIQLLHHLYFKDFASNYNFVDFIMVKLGLKILQNLGFLSYFHIPWESFRTEIVGNGDCAKLPEILISMKTQFDFI